MAITNAFLNALRNFIYGDTIVPPSHMAVGSGGTSSTDYGGLTALVDEKFRKAFTNRTKGSNAGVVQLDCTITSTDVSGNGLNGQSWNEIGAFNAASAGTMTFGQFFTAFTVALNTEYRLEVTLTAQRP